MSFLRRDTLRHLWPRCSPAIVDGVIASQDRVFAKYGVTSARVVAIIMGEISHEFGAGAEMEENLNYRAEQLLRQWPKHFTRAQAYAMAHKPRLIANQAYNGRMGNRPGTDDGWDFRGRGGSQLTGRENYEKLSRVVGLDLLNHPEYLSSPEHFLECSVADFVMCGCLPYAEKNDVYMVTQRLNGGQIGAAARKAWIAKFETAMATEHGEDAVAPPPKPADGMLRYGDSGWQVRALQEKLAALGYSVGKTDGKFGASTRAAVLAFQADSDIETDGAVGPKTRDALTDAAPRPVGEERAATTAEDLRAAGSRTIAASDSLRGVGKAGTISGGVVAIATGAVQSGALSVDSVQAKVDQVKRAYTLWDSIRDVAAPLLHNPVVLVAAAVVVAICVVVYVHARQVADARVDDARTGANMSR
jgi:putative chitinase